MKKEAVDQPLFNAKKPALPNEEQVFMFMQDSLVIRFQF